MANVVNEVVRNTDTGEKLWLEKVEIGKSTTSREVIDPTKSVEFTKVPNPQTDRCTCTTKTPYVMLTQKWKKYRIDVYSVTEKSVGFWGVVAIIGVAAAVVGAVVLTGGIAGAIVGASSVFAGIGGGIGTGTAVLTGLGLLATGAGTGSYAIDSLNDDEERGSLLETKEVWEEDGPASRGTQRVDIKSEDCDCNSSTTTTGGTVPRPP